MNLFGKFMVNCAIFACIIYEIFTQVYVIVSQFSKRCTYDSMRWCIFEVLNLDKLSLDIMFNLSFNINKENGIFI